MTAKLPANLASLQLTSGSYRSGLKILVYGRFKTGKSYLAASAPGPIFALCNGEPGLIPYLDPRRGDVGLEIHSAADYYAALEFALKHEKDFATFVSDNDNLAWAQTMEDFEDEKGGEIKGGDWRKIKGPRKAMLRQLGHGKPNMVFTCWLRETVYKQGESAIPGVEGRMEILPAEIPDIEKTTVSLADLIFLTDVKKDKFQKPTSVHLVTYVGGRRPRTVSPESLFTGKTWTFDSRKPVVSVWDEVITPFHKVWQEGGEEHLGVDPKQVATDKAEMDAAFHDQEVGRIIAMLEGCPTKEALAIVRKGEEKAVNDLPPERRAAIVAVRDRRLKELGA